MLVPPGAPRKGTNMAAITETSVAEFCNQNATLLP